MKFQKLLGIGAVAALVLSAFGASAAQANQTIGDFTISVSTVEAGGTFTASVSDPTSQWFCTDGEPGEVFVEIDSEETDAVVEPSGTWSAVVVAPTSPGTYTVSVTCASYGQLLQYNDRQIVVTAAPGGSDGSGTGGTGNEGPGTGTPPATEVCNDFTKSRGEGWPGVWPEGELSATNKGNYPASISNNNQLTVNFGPTCVGQQFNFGNDRLNLGTWLPNSHVGGTAPSVDGTATVTVPSAAAGTYKIALQAINGLFFGWVEVTTSGNGVWSLSDQSSDTVTPAAPAESSLTAANRGGVTISNISGNTVRLTAGVNNAGQTVYGTVFSTPVPLGAAVVDAQGNVTFTLPSGLHAGNHKIALQAANGDIIGWASIVLTSDGTWTVVSLAHTGAPASSTAMTIGSLLLAAGALTVVLRRVRAAHRISVTQ